MESKVLANNMRKHVIRITSKAKAGHVAPIMSITDIVAVLYGGVMKYDPKKPKSPTRDIFILSKGHAGCALYCALAESGFFPVSDLDNYYTYGSLLSGHVSHKVSGVELTTGALGHGPGVAVGFAYSFKLENKPNKVYVLVGDGECNQGSVWEAVMLAAQLKLDNLCFIIDRNRLQCLGKTDEIINMDNMEERFKAFGCATTEIDGHDHDELRSALLKTVKGQPTAIIANTIKGKGISFIENLAEWHSKALSPEQAAEAIKILEAVNA